MNLELYNESEGAGVSDDGDSPPPLPLRKSTRAVDRNERERQQRIAESLEEESEEVDGVGYDQNGPRRPVAVIIRTNCSRLSEYQAVGVTYCQCNNGLSHWEKHHHDLKAEAYYPPMP